MYEINWNSPNETGRLEQISTDANPKETDVYTM